VIDNIMMTLMSSDQLSEFEMNYSWRSRRILIQIANIRIYRFISNMTDISIPSCDTAHLSMIILSSASNYTYIIIIRLAIGAIHGPCAAEGAWLGELCDIHGGLTVKTISPII